jgi:hypothetical protein
MKYIPKVGDRVRFEKKHTGKIAKVDSLAETSWVGPLDCPCCGEGAGVRGVPWNVTEFIPS